MAQGKGLSSNELQFDALPMEVSADKDLNDLLPGNCSVTTPVLKLTPDERQLLADFYLFIQVHSDEESLMELKKEKYQRFLNVDITALSANRRYCNCRYTFEGIYFVNNLHKDVHAVADMIKTGQCPHVAQRKGEGQMASFKLLHLAATSNCKEIIKYLLTTCEGNVDCLTGHSRCSPVYLAVNNGDDVTARYLLDFGANPNCVTYLNTLLLKAISTGCDGVVDRILCGKSYNVNLTNQKGETALKLAVDRQNKDLVTQLIEAGCDVNKTYGIGWTALCCALKDKNVDIVSILLKAGASVSVKDDRGMFPLLIAINERASECVQLILDAGADPDCVTSDGSPALVVATLSDQEEIVAMLIAHKANVDATNLNGYSALHCAALYSLIECVELLLKAGASHDRRTRDGNTPLALAAYGGHLAALNMLFPLGCDVNNADEELDTPLHYAAYRGCLQLVVALVEGGAYINVRNFCNATPLWNAVYRCHTSVVRYLVRLNVELNIASRGIDYDARTTTAKFVYDEPRMPLAIAFSLYWKGNHTIIELLLMAGYDIWNEKWLVELSSTVYYQISTSSPAIQALYEQLLSQVRTPPSLFHLCKMSLRKTHKCNLDKFMKDQETPGIIFKNVVLEGIDKCSEEIHLESFGKIF